MSDKLQAEREPSSVAMTDADVLAIAKRVNQSGNGLIDQSAAIAFYRELLQSSPKGASKPQDERDRYCRWLVATGNHDTAQRWEGWQAARASQPSAASGREPSAFQEQDGDVFHYYDRKNNEKLFNSLMRDLNAGRLTGVTPLYPALTGAAPADANVGELQALCAAHDWRTDGDSATLIDRIAHHAREMKASIKAHKAVIQNMEHRTPTAPEVSAPADKVDADVVKDAERYRWIRSSVSPCNLRVHGGEDGLALQALDAAVDAAMTSMRSESGEGGKL